MRIIYRLWQHVTKLADNMHLPRAHQCMHCCIIYRPRHPRRWQTKIKIPAQLKGSNHYTSGICRPCTKQGKTLFIDTWTERRPVQPPKPVVAAQVVIQASHLRKTMSQKEALELLTDLRANMVLDKRILTENTKERAPEVLLGEQATSLTQHKFSSL